MNTVKLPELPEAVAYCEPNNPHNDDAFAWPGTGRKNYHTAPLFTAAQMESYARAAVEAGQPAASVIERAAEYGWQHPSWDWDSVRIGLVERFAPPAPKAEAVEGDPANLGELVWSEREQAAIAELMAEQNLSYPALMRCALRGYQSDWIKRRNGETCVWSGDAQRAREFAGPALTHPQPASGGEFDNLKLTPCWLVELFAPMGGNSLACFHTGLTDIGGYSRTTNNAHEAKKYATKEQAEAAVSRLFAMSGEWKAIEHGFYVATQPESGGQGEAVAWRDRDHEAGEWNYTDNPAWAAKYGERYQPLYTHPQPSVAVTEALKLAEAALADIGDADREPGDDVAWCEARAAKALPAIRAALSQGGKP